jgi:hypothetical protein
VELDRIGVGGPDEEETIPGAERGRTQNVPHSFSITCFSSILFLAETALSFHQVISVSRGSTIRDFG